MSQLKEILKTLESGQHLTPMDALKLYGCFRLAARVKDLRKAGHHIESAMVSNAGKRYSIYWMEANR